MSKKLMNSGFENCSTCIFDDLINRIVKGTDSFRYFFACHSNNLCAKALYFYKGEA